jgi:hypothetical protein
MCKTCGQPTEDIRHDHPHDYIGTVEAFKTGKPCLACRCIHAGQPTAFRSASRMAKDDPEAFRAHENAMMGVFRR